ncbi:WXG100 family type VII secretion target [Paenibacillus sp. FSL M7-0656]|uniref:WXG100 family type VII secretion target n=1 Tax=Paenibacillus sp. FSL M7-0656 TaxID=2921534 RepID=UPI0030FB0C47
MSTIKVTPEQLHHVSNQVDQARQQLESIRSDLTRQIMFVQMMWMGATQERFYYEFEQSRPILDKALEGMVNTSKELKDIATRFQDADAQKGSLGGAIGAVGAAAMMTKSTGDSSSGDKGYRMAQVNMFGKWVWMPVNENGVADQAALQAYQRDQGNLDFNRMQAVNVEPPGEDIFALQIKAFEMGIHPTTGEPVSDKYAQMMVTSLKFSQVFMALQMVRGSMPGSKGPYRLPASNPAVAKIKQHIEAAKAKNGKTEGKATEALRKPNIETENAIRKIVSGDNVQDIRKHAKKVTVYDNYSEIVTHDNKVVRINKDDMPNSSFNKLDELILFEDSISDYGMKSYDKIRNMQLEDVPDVAKNTGLNISDITNLKKHLFLEKHEIPKAGGILIKKEHFSPDDEIAYAWQLAQKKELNQAQKDWFKQLADHELTEAKLMREGIPYRRIESWSDDKRTYTDQPPNDGAHRKAPEQPEYGTFEGFDPFK